jgi:hypothetical protein
MRSERALHRHRDHGQSRNPGHSTAIEWRYARDATHMGGRPRLLIPSALLWPIIPASVASLEGPQRRRQVTKGPPEVEADHVVVDGRVEGPIRGGAVVLKSRAHVVGDIQHNSLAIESVPISTGARCVALSRMCARRSGEAGEAHRAA